MNPLTALWRRHAPTAQASPCQGRWRRRRRRGSPKPRERHLSLRSERTQLQAAAVRQQQYNFLHYTGDVQGPIHPYVTMHQIVQK